MIFRFLILVTTLFASTTFASSADLMGKWASSCINNNGGSYSEVIAMDIQASGNLLMAVKVFSDKVCTIPQGEDTFAAAYTATDATMHVKTNTQNDVIEIDSDYTIAGDTVTFTPTAAKENGQPAQFDPNPMTFKRVP